MRKILISIKPEYVKLILSGKKLYEYRKRVPSEVQIAVIYATSPIKKIVGEFYVNEILSMPPKDLWNKTHKYSGLSRDKFFQYFDGVCFAYALSIKKVMKYESPMDLSTINLKVAPQSWQYIDSEIYSMQD